MATIAGVTGKQYPMGHAQYELHAHQYASSSHESRCQPELVVYPSNKDDIVQTLKYATAKKIAVAVRSGGHQYSGASSTVAPNIQLDLKETFRGSEDFRLFNGPDGTTLVRTSVSWTLGEFNKTLAKNSVFIPHGQCVDVRLGGHAQTGGYGMLGRSFGLLGDYVRSMEVIDYAGNIRDISRTSDKDMFYAILGGSPGNFGVLTHLTVQVQRDSDYKGSMGAKALHLYNPTVLKRMLDMVTEMGDDAEFPGNYDLCVSVLSSHADLAAWFPNIEEDMKRDHPDIYKEYKDSGNQTGGWPRSIIVYGQWVPSSPNDTPDMEWFNRIVKGSLNARKAMLNEPMSVLTGEWIFTHAREFDHPYVKSTQMTTSRTLGRDGWAQWVTDRIDSVIKPEKNKLWLSVQIQCFGGIHSKFFTNRDNGTSYSWRDSSVVQVLDCFYGLGQKQAAENWQKGNHDEGIGANGKFSKDDRRPLWGSSGSYDLNASREYYYDTEAMYNTLVQIRKRADPNGTFTPNTFCVART